MLLFSNITIAQVYTDNSSFELVSANNGGQVRLRNAPGGSGNINYIRNLCDQAGLPAVVKNSRLTQGDYAPNICQMQAVIETLEFLANRAATYTGGGTVVNNSNLETHRAAIAGSGGTFIFRGTVNVTGRDKLIQVGPNTTIWIDGVVRYTGPVIPGTVPDQFSVSDVINGIFEVRGSNGNHKNGARFFGTKRGKLVGNDRLAGIYSRWSRNLIIEGVNTDNCRNVLFLHNVNGNSRVKGNFVFNSTRRAIHLKVTNGMLVENNLVFDADVDGIDVDAFAKNTNVNRNVIVKGGSRWQVWTEIVAVDNTIDGNVGVHVNETDGGFQENGSENGQAPTARNTWINNHVFYANSSSVYRQGFSFHPNRVIDKASTTFRNNFVWQTNDNAYKNNPKDNVEDDVSYYHYVGAPPVGGGSGGGNGGGSNDIARGKPAFQSSIYQNNNGRFGPDKAVDGNGNTFNHTNNENNPWWEVDLGSSYSISSVKIWNRGDCCSNRLNNFDIKVYNNRGGNETKNVYVSGQPSNNGSTYNINATGNVVRIQLRGNNRILHTDQVEVYGSANSGGSGGNGNPIVTLRKGNSQGFAIDGGNGGSNGQNVKLWAYNQNNVNQQWEEINRGNGFYSYKKQNTNFCIDAGNGGSNGQNVVLWSCGAGNQNQHFKKVSVSNNRFRLEKRNASGFSIDGNNGGGNNQNVHIWSSNNNNGNQQWIITAIGTASKNAQGFKSKNLYASELIAIPNPASNVLRLEGLGVGTHLVRVVNSLGALVLSKELKSVEGKASINVSNLNVGIYVLITGDKAIRFVKK